LLAPERRGQQRGLPDWPRLTLTGAALPWLRWETSRQAVLAGTAQAADWTARTGRWAREAAGTALPDAMTRANLLTPTHRPTLRSGVGLAVVVGLLVGATAAKCGVAGVAAESALASEPRTVIVQQAAPATPTLAESAAPTATEPPPTPVPNTATPPAPTPVFEPAVAAEAPPPPPEAPAQPQPPVRALAVPASAPPPAAVPAPAPPPATEPAPAPPPRAAAPEDDEEKKPRNNLSNTLRSDEKTPEERAKAEAKQNEEEKRGEPPKPARASTLPPYVEPARQQAQKPEPPKPQPQKQETKQQGSNGKEKKKD